MKNLAKKTSMEATKEETAFLLEKFKNRESEEQYKKRCEESALIVDAFLEDFFIQFNSAKK